MSLGQSLAVPYQSKTPGYATGPSQDMKRMFMFASLCIKHYVQPFIIMAAVGRP